MTFKSYLKSKRLFTGIPVAEDVAAALNHISALIPDQHLIRWTKPENYHITVRFYGQVPVNEMPAITNQLNSVVKEMAPFLIPFQTLCLFPPSKPSMIWAVFYNVPAFQALVHYVSQGKTNNQKKVIPHITLARFRNSSMKRSKPALPALHLKQPINANTLCLWRSVTKSSGAVYYLEDSFAFKQDDPL